MCDSCFVCVFFFFKQKTAYEMRISDWSSDVCSSDLQIANRRNVFAVARRLFRWAVSRGDIKISPMEGMETPKAVKPRERWLTDKELPRIWNAAPHTHPCFGPIVRLLLATGQRSERSEEHTSELQSLMRISYADFCLKK